jgi:uncharacterized protein
MTTLEAPKRRVTMEELRSRRNEILALAHRHGARNMAVFGSVARGEADGRSDVDFLVDMERGRSLFDMGALLMDLQDLLGCEVDVVTRKGLRERIRDRVLAEATPL